MRPLCSVVMVADAGAIGRRPAPGVFILFSWIGMSLGLIGLTRPNCRVRHTAAITAIRQADWLRTIITQRTDEMRHKPSFLPCPKWGNRYSSLPNVIQLSEVGGVNCVNVFG